MAQIILDDLPYEKRIAYLQEQANKRAFIEELKTFAKEGETYLYKLTVEGTARVQTLKSDFGITSMHELTFVGLDAETGRFRFILKELSYNLDKYEDPVVVQIIEMSNMISEIYQELDFYTDRYGNLKAINNREEIRKRWDKVKEYLTYKHPLSSYEIILTKEKEMAKPELEMNNIRFIHFIHMFFMQFGRYEEIGEFEVNDQDRFGSGVPFRVRMKYKTRKEDDNKIHRHMEGYLLHDPEVIKALSRAVKDPHADVVYKTRADYHGIGNRIEEANFSFEERIGESHHMYSHLNLKLVTEDGK
jgi:hypothetical protein